MEIDKFIEENIQDIEQNNFDIVYFRALKELESVSDLTKILLQADIDPLPYSRMIPHEYLSRKRIDSFEIPRSIERIGRSAFALTNIEKIVIPATVKTLDIHVFQGCVDLKQITFEEPCQIDMIPYSCFRSCIQLNNVYLPDSITKLKRFCFGECDDLSVISLGNKLVSISEGAFKDCPKLKTIKYRGTSQQWKDVILAEDVFNSIKPQNIKVECIDKTINFYTQI